MESYTIYIVIYTNKLSNVSLCPLGYFVPYMFLVPYAMEEESLSQNAPGRLVSVLGVSNIVGRLLSGLVANQSWSDPVSLYGASLIIGGLFTCVLPLLHAFELLCVYAGVTGICNGTVYIKTA